MLERISDPAQFSEEKEFDRTLRPKTLKDFVGQEQIKEILDISIQATKLRKEPLDHILFYGPPGLGKTTLANIIANELSAEIKVSAGPVLEKAPDLAGILTNLQRHDVFFIDENRKICVWFLFFTPQLYAPSVIFSPFFRASSASSANC